VRFFLVAALVLFGALWVRLLYLQVFQHGTLKDRARSQYASRVPIPAERGKIYDRKGEIIALSVPGKSIYVDPNEIDDIGGTSTALASALGGDASQVYEIIMNPPARHFAWVERLVTPAEEAAVRSLRLQGVYIREEPKRCYPNGSLAAHLVGFSGIDQNGLSGVEFAFDSKLRGTDGYRLEGRDGLARSIWAPENVYFPAVNGASVVLTIDTNIQDFLETAVDRCFQQYTPVSVTGIVMDPKTGDVLALAERPNFDPNRFAESPSDRWRIRAVTDTFEPGSMFKPFVFSGALQEKAIRLSEIFFCGDGSFQIGSRVLHDAHPYGNLSALDVMVKSSNIGMAQVGMRLGADKANQFVRAFGFGRATGVGLTGEADGYVVPAAKWSKYTITSVPMGHEVSVTAMQMATAFCAIANGGLLVKPRILRGVMSPDGAVLEYYNEPQVLGRVIDESVSKTMTREVLRKVVTDGTGRLANIEDYELAGKTGTAQKLVDGVYSHDKYVSSFVCTGPIENPRLVVLIVVNEPSRGASLYGGTVAAPQCAEVVKSTLDYMYIDSRRRGDNVRIASAEKAPAPAMKSRGKRNAP
jgi:cell division protein FtsI/penicillin-binding protein 2